MRSSTSAGSSHITSRSDRPSNGSTTAHTSSSAPANTGKRAASSRPIPGRCEPCPEKTAAVRPSPAVTGTTSDRASSAPARSDAGTTARTSNDERADTSDHATSGNGISARSRSRVASAAAWSRTACSERPESTNGSGPSAAGAWAVGSAAGASSTMMCALVPLMPKEEMPARRGRPSASHGRADDSSRTSPRPQSTAWVGVSACRVGGRTPCRMACTILMMPTTPAADWV